MNAKKNRNGVASKAHRGERLQIMLSAAELRVVDTFRFENRMPSRAAAVRELFRLGLAAALGKLGNIAEEGQMSSAYGVMTKTAPSVDK